MDQHKEQHVLVLQIHLKLMYILPVQIVVRLAMVLNVVVMHVQVVVMVVMVMVVIVQLHMEIICLNAMVSGLIMEIESDCTGEHGKKLKIGRHKNITFYKKNP